MQTVSIEQIRNLEPLSSLSAHSAGELARLSQVRRVSRGINPFTLRDLEDRTLFLLKGQMLVASPDQGGEVIVGGTDTSGFAISKRADPRLAAKAITDVELLYIDNEVLDVLLTWEQLAAANRPTAQGKNSLVSGSPDWHRMSGLLAAENILQGAFSALPAAHIATLLERFDRIDVSAGETVIRERDPGEYYFVIESGRAVVSRRIGSEDMPIAELKPGDAFGEEALVANTLRNASVTMKTAGKLLRVAKEDFIELLREPLLHRIDIHAAHEKGRRGAVWMDVRFPGEYRRNKIEGAINIPVSEIRNLFDALDRNKEYIVYCQSGRRSSAAAFLLSQAGYQAYMLEGGLWAGARAE